TVNQVTDTGIDPRVELDIGEVYRSDNWDAPFFKVFDPPLYVGLNEGVRFTCTYFNETNDVIGFGGHADVQEHCNLFFPYYDGNAQQRPFACGEGSCGW